MAAVKPADEDKDIFDGLEKEAKEFDKDAEIDRILNAFKLDAYAVLDLQPGVTTSDIKKCYRVKSLLIHPDKTSNPRAPDAFDRLKKAQTELDDEKHRERLDESIADARMLLIREKKWDVNHPDLQSDAFREEWRSKTKLVLMDDEIRRRKQLRVQMQEEGRAQKKEEEELAERKRKRDHQEQWEATREKRIGSWRDFQTGKKPQQAPSSQQSNGTSSGGGAAANGTGTKKKKKMKVLG